MQVSVTFKNIDSSDSIKDFVQEKLDKFDRLFDGAAEANVILSVEKFRNIAEINLTGDRLNLNGKEETEDMYAAIDLVLDKIEKQIKKGKQKVKDHRSAARRSKKKAASAETP
ncbi:MAG: ribosome-associated translation inhibitor RaiA [Thermodesulfobacteriota bacterium]|nr:ribosome-associated translation inhibitor RaiA [Thermodesulfobacteriota bacterium]